MRCGADSLGSQNILESVDSLSILSDSLGFSPCSRLRSGSKKQLMLSVAGLEKSKLDALCKEAAAKEA